MRIIYGWSKFLWKFGGYAVCSCSQLMQRLAVTLLLSPFVTWGIIYLFCLHSSQLAQPWSATFLWLPSKRVLYPAAQPEQLVFLGLMRHLCWKVWGACCGAADIALNKIYPNSRDQGVAVVPPDVAETLPDDGLWLWTHPCCFLLTAFGEPMKGKHQGKLKIRQFFPRMRLGY